MGAQEIMVEIFHLLTVTDPGYNNRHVSLTISVVLI